MSSCNGIGSGGPRLAKRSEDKVTGESVTQYSPWTRLLYVLLFVAAFKLVEAVIYVVLAAQFVFHLFNGRPNARLQDLGKKLGSYLRQLVRFLTYQSDDLPYPFGDWPRS